MAYVYAVIVDGVIRYIGKGSGGRLHYHMKMVRKIARRRAAGETIFANHFYNRLTKAWLDGCQIEFSKLVDGVSDVDAFEREAKEIAKAPSGQLWNKAPGGEGFSTEQWNDPEFRQKMKAAEASKRTPEYRAKRSAIAKEIWRSRRDEMVAAIWNDERRAKAATLREQRKTEKAKQWLPYASWNEKQKAEASDRRRIKALQPKKSNAGQFKAGHAKVHSDEQRSKIIDSNRRTWSDPELRAEHSERCKVLWLRPEYRRKLTGRKWTPEMRAALSAKRKAQWADPDFRAKMDAAFSNPDFHLKRTEATKRGWKKRRATVK